MERVAVVGCGLMGSGIAEVCARAGVATVVLEVSQELLERGQSRIIQSLSRAVANDHAGRVGQAAAPTKTQNRSWAPTRDPAASVPIP